MDSTKYQAVGHSYQPTHIEDEKPTSALPTIPQSWRGGWRLSLLLAVASTATVFLLNFIVMMWAFTQHEVSYGSAILFQGSCEKTKDLSIIVHLIINAFSSVILGGSNYAMQCLSLPTRMEVDDAHAKGSWLDIGVPSIRNLKSIAKKRKWLWILLVVTSIPLHLFYNSVVFTTLSASDYRVLVINEEWATSSSNTNSTDIETLSAVERRLWEKARAGELDRLDPLECINEHARPFVSTRANLLVVTSSDAARTEAAEVFGYGNGGGITITGGMDAITLDPYPWICDYFSFNQTDSCDVDALGIRKDPSRWTLEGRRVDYCLSEPVEEHCILRMSVAIASIVIVLNFVKAALILFVCLAIKDRLLLSMGDAVASFLETPVPTTQGSSLLSKEDATRKVNGVEDYSVAMGPRVFRSQRRRWFAAATRRRLLSIFLASLFGIFIVSILLIYGVFKMPGASSSEMWTMGFGEATEHTLMTFQGIRRRMIRSAGVINNVLIANVPQLFISGFYFACNALLTSMLLCHEWSGFAYTRKGLRVQSKPQGSQRSSHFLQLPWRYGIPMTVAGIALHWLCSQSIFLVTVEQWTNESGTGNWVHDDFDDFATCAYSPLAMFLFVVAAAALLLVLFLMGLRRFRSGMPVAGSCSLAIAAACQRQDGEDPSMAQRPLQWGVIYNPADIAGQPPRCGFSSGEVRYPMDGQMYS